MRWDGLACYPAAPRPGAHLTAPRRDLFAILLLVVVLGMIVTRIGILTPRGVPTDEAAGAFDFRAFYTAASMVWEGEGGELLDLDAQADAQSRIFPDDRPELMGFFNPPGVALALSPLGALRPGLALAVWQIIGDLLWLAILAWALWRGSQVTGARWLLVIVAIAAPPILLTRLSGQLVPPLVLGTLGCVFALSKKRPLEAGFWLVLCLVKPHIGLLIGVWAALVGGPRVWVGVLAGVVAVVGASAIVAGPEVVWEYPAFLMDLAARDGGVGLNPTWETTLRSGLRGIAGDGWLVDAVGLVASLVFAGVLLAAAWRDRHDPTYAVRALIPVLMLVPLHTLPHDHALWLVPLAVWRPSGRGLLIAGLALAVHWLGFALGVWPVVCGLLSLAGAAWALIPPERLELRTARASPGSPTDLGIVTSISDR